MTNEPKTQGCVETDWLRTGDGYGRRWVDGVHWRAHRYAWTQANGPIPAGMMICHHCDNPACIRLDHLYLGTAADNSRDAHERGRAFRPRRGERNGNARLTDAQVEEMRPLFGKVTNAELGRRYGVSDVAIHYIRRGIVRGN